MVYIGEIASSLFVIAMFSHVVVRGKVETDGDGGGGTISFGMDHNDEFDYDMHMPTQLKCDACIVISYQLTKRFKEAHKKRPSVRKFEESDILDITDSVCDQTWEGYGIKQVEGVHRLSGEGMETEEVPGITQSGGKTPERLKEMCLMYMGELGEMAVYESYLSAQQLETYLCKSSGVRNVCARTRDNVHLKSKKSADDL